MKIGIDARPLRERQISGVPAYVRNILASLAKLDQRNEYFLYTPKPVEYELPNDRWHLKSGGFVKYGTIWMQTDVPFLMRRDKIDIFWGTQHVLPMVSYRPVKFVLTLLDLIYSVHPETMQFKNRMITRLMIPPSVSRADAVVAISQSTMNDLHRILEPKGKIMEVTYMAANQKFEPQPQDECQAFVRKKYGVDRPYILSVGAFEPRKNLGRVVEAFGRVADRIPQDLVIVGPDGWKNQDILEKLATSRVRERIHHVGYVPREDLPPLYAGADVFVFASIYEGFGIPPLEAMACGTPVISSRASSLPEVVGDAARLVDPFSVDDIQRAFFEVCRDGKLLERMRTASLEQAKKFSWDDSGKKMLSVFGRLEALKEINA
jgi:glycosyltransferase involved in cell wall biosynthesis